MSNLTRQHAEATAEKLKDEPPGPTGFTISDFEGREHRIIQIVYQGQWVGQFGIRRGKRDLPHNYIGPQLGLTRREVLDFANCSISVPQLIEILREKNVL